MHDVQWTPAGDYFVAVAGFMPAKTTLFSATCKPIFELGSGPHNLARWSPQVIKNPSFPLGFWQIYPCPLWKFCMHREWDNLISRLTPFVKIAVQGRFLALAGFGNLPGDIVFFDRKSDGRCKQMGAVRCVAIQH